MKKIYLFILLSFFVCSAAAKQNTEEINKTESGRYSQRYDLLVSKLGAAGVGVETLLNNWEAVDPENKKLILAKYSYYFTKSQTTSVVPKDADKFLGNKAVITLKDSTGRDVNYFEETFYEDSLFSLGLKYIDKAIGLWSDDLDLKFSKAAALVAYEKESPDMALAYLNELVDEYYTAQGKEWKFNGEKVDADFFENAIQEYCYLFYRTGTPAAYGAFKSLSEKMLEKDVASYTNFLSNIGTYYLVVEENYKKALKTYDKVLKVKPDDYTAIKNCILLSRRQKNEKLEKKYLPKLIEVTPNETERLSAQARLKALGKK